MQTCALQSGSNGNSIYVEADGVRLLFDAGISGRQAALRLGHHGRDIRRVDALIISHDHADHVRCAGVFQRKFGLPLYISPRTYAVAGRQLGRLHDVRSFQPGESIEFGKVVVHTIPTPHDAAEGVAFVVECGSKRLGIFTDLGHPGEHLLRELASVDAAYLESNYDPMMLETGPYPYELKVRIRGAGGHLSNDEAALALRAGRRRHRWGALAHLSEHNNRPETALATAYRLLGESAPELLVASRYAASPMLSV